MDHHEWEKYVDPLHPPPVPDEDYIRRKVPPELSDYYNVFSKVLAEWLPQHSAHDHAVPLKDETQIPPRSS